MKVSMKLCLAGLARTSCENIRATEISAGEIDCEKVQEIVCKEMSGDERNKVLDALGVVEKAGASGLSSAYAVQVACDALRIIFAAKPENLADTVQSLRDFLCVESSPLPDYHTITHTTDDEPSTGGKEAGK